MKRLFLSLFLYTFCMISAFSSKAVSRSFEVRLADGRNVTVMLRGDENFHYYATDKGERIVFDNNVWRVMTDTEQKAMRAYAAQRAIALPSNIRPFPSKGTPKALVIMVSYSDLEFTYDREKISAWLNSSDYVPLTQDRFSSYSSVAQFFNDNSNGKYRPVFDVVGPYKMSNPMAYYGKNSYGRDNDSLIKELVEEACAAADADSTDFTQYDADNDGYVDLVYVFYAGYGENFGGVPTEAIWPKAGRAENFKSFDGKKLYRFGMSNELLGYPGLDTEQGWDKPKLNGIGVFVHEMCHTLGLPDVYPTENWDDVTMYDNQSMEEWDIMDGGENLYNGLYPSPFTAWEREWLGWIDEIETISESGTYTLKPLREGGKAYRIKNPNDSTGNEFYILENVPSRVPDWYYMMPGSGMLVTHINYDKTAFSNFKQPNNVQGKPRWTIIPANDTIYTSYRRGEPQSSAHYLTSQQINANRAGNPFPGTGNVSSLSEWREYTPQMDVTLTNIVQAEDGTITFDFATPTSVDRIAIDRNSIAGKRIYMIDGRYAGDNIDNLPSGLYIIDGKKIIK